MKRRNAFRLAACETLEGRQLLSVAGMAMAAGAYRHGFAHVEMMRADHAAGQIHGQSVRTGMHGLRANEAALQQMQFRDGQTRSWSMADPSSPTMTPAPAGTTSTPASTAAPVAVTATQAPTATTIDPVTPGGGNWGGFKTSATGLPGGLTLSTGDVAGIKSAVDTFAGAYTSGANAATDKAAVAALQTALKGVSWQVWAETHVASQSSVTALQSAVNAFAQNYTNNTNPAADATAWTALHSTLKTFNTSLTNPEVTTTATATGTTAAMPPAAAFAGHRPMGMGMGTSMDTGLGRLAAPLANGVTLSAADLATVKTAVDTFAGAYTSGANVATDKAAVTALETGLAPVLTGHQGTTSGDRMLPMGRLVDPTAATTSNRRGGMPFAGRRWDRPFQGAGSVMTPGSGLASMGGGPTTPAPTTGNTSGGSASTAGNA